MKEVLLIITGSVAAFKSLELIRLLKKSDIKVRVVLSSGGEAFVTALSASALSGEEVFTKDTYKMEHILLSRTADLIVICPASADFISKIANGIGGELALDIILAKKAGMEVLVFPAMNTEMWKNEAVIRNVKELEYQGFTVINPEKGELLCKEEGYGKLPKVEDIKKEIDNFLEVKNSLSGKKFLITSGASIERIDDARFISNFSSGLQGALIAKELLKRGGEVFLIEGSTAHSITLPLQNLHYIKVESAKEMLSSVIKILEESTIDAFFGVAAVADFAVKNRASGKFKKDELTELILEKNPDILASVGNLTKNRPNLVIGFAAEERQNVLLHGKHKLLSKNCDFIFANPMCFKTMNTEGFLISKTESLEFSGTKHKLTSFLISKIMLK